MQNGGVFFRKAKHPDDEFGVQQKHIGRLIEHANFSAQFHIVAGCFILFCDCLDSYENFPGKMCNRLKYALNNDWYSWHNCWFMKSTGSWLILSHLYLHGIPHGLTASRHSSLSWVNPQKCEALCEFPMSHPFDSKLSKRWKSNISENHVEP